MAVSKPAGGYWGRLLRVDLTNQQVTIDGLPEPAVLRRVIGGIGLGMWLLLKETRPDMSATDPDAPLLLMTGPLTGTAAPSSSNLAVVSLNYNTPYAVATAHTHGYWAAFLKHAGYDGIVVTGRASRPVYLWVDDDNVEFRDASHLWGTNTRDTERLIKRELRDEENVSVACIGPAGEAMLHGAGIKNDRNHGASKGSVGAVMGSKRLKAVAVRGTKDVPLSDRAGFVEVTTRWQESILTDPAPGQASPSAAKIVVKGGIIPNYHFLGDGGMVAGKNLSDPAWSSAHAHKVVEASKNWTIVPKESYNCNIACAYDCKINTGPYAGFTASLCGGGENFEGASAMVGIDDPSEGMVLTDYFDSMGIDSSVAGALMGMAFELYNRGRLTTKETGGLELTWGNYEAAVSLLDQMCDGTGFGGQVLAKGLKEASRLLGKDAEECVVHIRGGGINMHDWRPAWSVLLGQIVAGAGVCWQGPGVDNIVVEPDLGYEQFSPTFSPKGKAAEVSRTQFKKLWEDTLGICWFACWGVKGVLDNSAQAIALSTGWTDFNRDEAMAVGERLVNLQRVIAIKRGFRPEDEFDVSKRLLEAPTVGPAAGKSIATHLRSMVADYYGVMGWEDARPTPATLAKVGLAGLL